MSPIVLSRNSVGRLAVLVGASLAAKVGTCQDLPKLSGVVETYWLSNSNARGSYQMNTWAELKARINSNWSAVWSGYDAQSFAGYDESYVRYEVDAGSVRVGRLRSSFGFSDWSELLYSGINHRPLVRECNLVGKIKLDRDDSGAEASANFGPLQIQAAMIDTGLTRAQVGPDKLDHATVTAQYGLGQVILGGEFLGKTDLTEKLVGANVRYTVPHWIFKGEFFEGIGAQSGSGGYLDAIYRIPYRLRTEVVARVEQVHPWKADDDTVLTTLGIRHIVNQNLTLNLNYGWGKDLFYSNYATTLGATGWSLRAMFQVQF